MNQDTQRSRNWTLIGRLLRYALRYKGTVTILMIVTIGFSFSYLAPLYLLDIFLGHVVELDETTAIAPDADKSLLSNKMHAASEGIMAAKPERRLYLLPWQDKLPEGDKERKVFILIQYILPVGVIMCILTLVLQYTRLYLRDRLRMKIIVTLQNDVFSKLLNQSLSFFEKTKAGELISRLTNDIQTTHIGMRALLGDLLKDSVTVVVGIALMVMIALQSGWMFLLYAVGLMLIIGMLARKFNKKVQSKSMDNLESMAELTAIMQEMFSGMRVIKAYRAEDRAHQDFFQGNRRVFRRAMRLARIKALNISTVNFVRTLAVVGLLVIGGMLAVNGNIHFRNLIIFIGIIVITLEQPIKHLPKNLNNLMESLAGAARIFELIDQRPEIQEAQGAGTLARAPQVINFEHVDFRYEAEPILQDITFCAEQGTTVAIVGHSGAGKTTLVDLIPRLYDVNGGRITIGGHDIREYTFDSLIDNIAIVPQESFLFHTTVLENIRYGCPDASDKDVFAAAKAAHCDVFIQKLDQEYSTIVGDRGVKLSGGQRQRLAIARAIVKNAPILLLDEATSELDSESEKMVQAALKDLQQDRTTLVIAHRLSTVRGADKIIVLHKGQLIEQGTHEALMAKNGHYQKLCEVQFGHTSPEAQEAAS